MLRRMYDRTMGLAGHRHSVRWLAVVSFAESSIFPIPPDVMLIPMVLADRERAWWIATVCTVASVLGGFAGYAIGFFLFETVGRPIIEFYAASDAFEIFQQTYNEWGFWAVMGGGITPLPYKVITILSGVTKLDVAIFAIASVISRGLRFYVEAGLLWYFGERIRGLLEAHLGKAMILLFVLLIGGFAVVKFAF